MLMESTAKTNCIWIMTSHWTNIIRGGDAAPFSKGNSICWNSEWRHEITPVLNTFRSLNRFNSHSSFVPARDDTQQLTFIIQNPLLNHSSNQKETWFAHLKNNGWTVRAALDVFTDHYPDSVCAWIDLKARSNYLEKVKSIHYRLTCFCYWAQGEKGECSCTEQQSSPTVSCRHK